MSFDRRELRLAGAFATLLIFALGVGCTGFFVNPTLTSLAVGPATPTIDTGSTDNTVQMTAVGTNNDGSTTTSPSVSWSLTPTSVATISTSGLVTSVSLGTATVTATSNQNPTITGTQTVTVTVGCIESIEVTPTSPAPLTESNTTDALTATATTCNGPADVTDVATWFSSNTALATVSDGTVSEVTTSTTSGTVNVYAYIGSVTSNTVSISVTPGS